MNKNQENPDFYRTKLMVEVEISHQFSPRDAMSMVEIRLNPATIPAIKNFKIVSGETNYRLFNTPDDKMTPFELDNPFDINTSPR